MTVIARNGNVIVECEDINATQMMADIVAKTFADNWLEGASDSDPLCVDVRESDGSLSKYMVRVVTKH